MVRVYGQVWTRLRSELDGLLEGYARALADGEDVSGWLYRQERFETLLRQTQTELKRFAQYADSSVREQQSAAVEAALRDAQAQVRAIGNTAGASFAWTQLPSDVLEDLVGFASNGSPLRELLDRLGQDASERIRQGLADGIAQGLNPEQVASQVRDAFGGDLVRALRVSRTETLRAYREATRRSYEGNSDVIDQWVWICACTPRSCAACWAMSGTLHPLTEQLESHPNCRCSMGPVVKGTGQWLPQAGDEQFAKLEEGAQKSILGPLYDLYQTGQIKLADVVRERFDPDWGLARTVKPLSAFKERA